MKHVRSFFVLATFMIFTLPLMPVQLLFLKFGSDRARTFPHWYHRWVCKILGIRVHVEGEIAEHQPGKPGVLLISNHVSWLDIPVLSAVAPVSFIAKREVSTWPFVSWLAKLQRSVFVDREKPKEVGTKASEILNRLRAGDNVVLFAEGTSSDGNYVLPFKTSLFASVKPRGKEAAQKDLTAQTLAVSYRRIYGLPVGCRRRHLIGWYGDMDMGSHGWRLLGLGPLDVSIRLGPPVPLAEFEDRKALARYAETKVRHDVIELSRGRPLPEPA
ncbi:lysophospholipid acyltransferase family protein [Methyloligella sp. 2.7D]|uniref:lysophospholipid acyltransferase family protein n=1 Tax=unclassified Methyloligella TaxID=2625955 RepID=UPI00157D972B|nr:lysophospholipid acyltransferase family protein [Methyloligella sp. GL2]QKP76138.1 1-acyl-sn-glycerol-3-phosphate acyltransferase [Methyloligella sp. GL2]